MSVLPKMSYNPFKCLLVLLKTWVTDETRLREIQWQLRQSQAVNEVLLIVYSTFGGPIQGLPSLSDRLKRMTSVLLDGMHSPSVHFSILFYFCLFYFFFLTHVKSTICIQTYACLSY